MREERCTVVGPSGGLVDDDTKKVVVPGCRAPTIRVPGLFNSMPRILAKYGDKLGRFVHSFLSNVPRSRDETHSLGPLWPIPVPYPEVFGGDATSGPTWRKRRTCLQVLVMSWLYLGRPRV